MRRERGCLVCLGGLGRDRSRRMGRLGGLGIERGVWKN